MQNEKTNPIAISHLSAEASSAKEYPSIQPSLIQHLASV
jgi:hypothetical protein